MPTLRELSIWIRDYGQDPRHQSRLLADRFLWHQLWTAMDVIDDVESALTAYTKNEFPTEVGEKYLRIYGVMQALFLEQDALDDLIKAIHPAKDICVKDILKDIRGSSKRECRTSDTIWPEGCVIDAWNCSALYAQGRVRIALLPEEE